MTDETSSGRRETWLEAVVRVARREPVVRAVVIEVRGSAPREVGAWMLVTATETESTIGGGAMEHAVTQRARDLLATGSERAWLRDVQRYHLGPELNQCCGGAVGVLLERFAGAEISSLSDETNRRHQDAHLMRPLRSGVPARIVKGLVAPAAYDDNGEACFREPLEGAATPLFIYGAGHVGRALVHALRDLPFEITWADGQSQTSAGQSPAPVVIRDSDLAKLAAQAPPGAYHLVMTHSHALDAAIVAAILHTGTFGYLGLIGSETKAARFRQRLRGAGISVEAVARLHCPIGLPALSGKSPAEIAASVAADLLLRRQGQPDVLKQPKQH